MQTGFIMVFFTAMILGLASTPIAIWLAPKIGAVDIPKDNRRMHTKPMPRFGGMAIFIGTTTALCVATWVAWPMLSNYFVESLPGAVMLEQPVAQMPGVIIGGILIYILGVIDDLKGMPAKVKLIGQIACASVVFAFGVRITFVTNHFGEGHSFFPMFISYMITVIWIVGITNTVNLIDGLDGLAAGVAAIAALCLAYATYIHGAYVATLAMLAIAGGAIGFLPFNFHPAKIFMGDGGSLYLGFMLASISIIGPVKGATIFATVVPFLVLGLPIFDTAFAIIRRLANKRPIMEADKGHLHHRIMAAGMGQRRTVLMLYGISATMSMAAILFSRDLFLETMGLVLIAATFIYIFLVDDQTRKLKLKAINIAEEEKREAKEAKETRK